MNFQHNKIENRMVTVPGAEKKPGKQFETYKKVSTLGTGSFGTAYLVQCLSNNELAVIKQIDIA